ncbi:putative F-box protein At1g49610 [Fagus crenata]
MAEESYASRSSTSREDNHSSDNNSRQYANPNSWEELEDIYQRKRRKYNESISDDSDHDEGPRQDRISALPDSILLCILSSLPTKDAIQTGVLSKRWAYLWTSVPSLSFSNEYWGDADDFASDIDNTLILHRATKLTNFSVVTDYDSGLKPRLDLWVRFATTAKVDKLMLSLSSNPYSTNSKAYVLPQHLYANEFVSELEFNFCKIKPSGVVNLSSLKRLCIGDTEIDDNAIKKVVMGSPRLEYLGLYNCCQVNRLEIASESLKKLVIRDYYMRSSVVKYGLELEIVAPKIESLEILGSFTEKKFRIKDVSSLVEAKLDFNISTFVHIYEEDDYLGYQETVRELLQSLRHVKELTVGRWCLMVLSIMSVKHLPFPLSKCKCLTMKTCMNKSDLLGIASLLQSSPYVETLVIDIESSYLPMFQHLENYYCCCSGNYDEVSHWKSKEIYFMSLLLRLKTVKIFGFGEGVLYIKEVFILVVQFLLENAKVLEKMVFCEPRVKQNQTFNMLQEFLQVAQKLLSFPRSSPSAVVMFPYH